MAFNTGGGTQVTFAAIGTFFFRTIDGVRAQAPQVDGTPLSQVGQRSYIVPDIQDLQPFAGELFFDTLAAINSIPVNLTPDTITITFPLGIGEAAPATLVGSGWLSGSAYPRMEHNEPMISPVELQWAAAPVYTPATAV